MSTTLDISRDTGINHQAITRKFPHYVGRILNDNEIAEILEYYMTNPRIDEDKKAVIQKVMPQEELPQQRLDIPFKNIVYLICLILLISMQAWHFSHIAGDAARAAGRDVVYWIDFMMGFLFESVAILITIDRVKVNSIEGDQRKGWLVFFAILAFVTNSVYYSLWSELSLYATTGKLMASLALPVAILAFSHLFNKSF